MMEEVSSIRGIREFPAGARKPQVLLKYTPELIA